MSILVRFTPESATLDQYDETVRRLEAEGQLSPDGQELLSRFETYRLCGGWDSNPQGR